MSQRLIMHIDLDAFFASIEQRDHPEYQGRPLVVGAKPGKRGVVATCSYEARRYGVRSAMPISEAVRRLPPETVYLRPSMTRYGEVSRQIMRALEGISPAVEKVSVDEAFLDISGMQRLIGPPEVIGRRAKSVILEGVGLTASVGIGPNRLIAKLASDFRKPDGLTIVLADQVQAFLDPQPLTVLRGLGAKSAPVLQRIGLRTVADVRRLSLLELRRHLGDLAGTKIHEQAHGIASDRVHLDSERKSISKETTFNEDITDPEIVRDTLHWAAQEVGYIARQEGRRGSIVTVKIRFQGFETHTRSRTLTTPTSTDKEIFQQAWELYQSEQWVGRPVRLVGLGVSGWASDAAKAAEQADLFDEITADHAPKQERLYQTMDAVSDKFGRKSVRFGVRRRKE
ncbi:MAG: DNA polymerase IV [Candidatus Thiodiazotropha sp. (ex Lucina aurantia)]|nr:DNA polymerase IV [Candidatus Thiodiazotropha taylori]MBV2100456.1 DNA polymerase IV [Candidatus Thiodiazotropha sp. (ex Codakia orbicularis)]MBV2104782.1 DNA polymerase IV [Candidatus Thiodiazotropha sp. (ex Lucina aurantia)]MBV2119351.1 DNA polymerase IV [Candidatus Thiodiazotropha sp. (ex Lucina aurantia)]